MNRALGIILAGVWIIAMTAVVRRDVLPFWTAQEAPKQIIPVGEYQVGIFSDSGARVGTTWVSTAGPRGIRTTISSTTVLDLAGFTGFLPVGGQLILTSNLTYDDAETLDQFSFRLNGPGIEVLVEGQRYIKDYACEISGAIKKTVSLDGELSAFLGQSLRPFTHVQGLHVGQSWRIHLLDPFSLIPGRSPKFKTQLARVTCRETITHTGGQVACFRIETDGTIAWADDSGRILRQEVEIPLLGRFVLEDEPYDQDAMSKTPKARQAP